MRVMTGETRNLRVLTRLIVIAYFLIVVMALAAIGAYVLLIRKRRSPHEMSPL